MTTVKVVTRRADACRETASLVKSLNLTGSDASLCSFGGFKAALSISYHSLQPGWLVLSPATKTFIGDFLHVLRIFPKDSKVILSALNIYATLPVQLKREKPKGANEYGKHTLVWTAGSYKNTGPAVLDFKANIGLFLLQQQWRRFSWIPSGPQESAPDGRMWLAAKGNESPAIQEVEVAKHQHTFWRPAHVWSHCGTHLRSWGSVSRCGPRGTCRLAAYPAISVPLPQRALCDWPAGTSWVSLLAPQRRLDHS